MSYETKAKSPATKDCGTFIESKEDAFSYTSSLLFIILILLS